MALESFYPVLVAEDVQASARVYTEHMGFAPTFESDWYVSLRHQENPAYELEIISRDHGTIPEGFRHKTSALLLNFGVPDAEGEYGRLRSAGVEVPQPLEARPSGRRHFICRVPDVMVDVVQEVPSSPSSRSGTSRRSARRSLRALRAKFEEPFQPQIPRKRHGQSPQNYSRSKLAILPLQAPR